MRQPPIPDTTENFLDILQQLDAGVFLQKIATGMRDTAMSTTQHHDKVKGKVIIELTMERIGDGGQILVSHKLKYDRPTPRGKSIEEDTTSTPLYVGARGKLTATPDTQEAFEFDTNSGEIISK